VIFEKPMAATYEQAKEMLALATRQKIKVMINYQMAWWPENFTAHDFAASGQLGKVWRVRSIIGHGGPAPRDASDTRGQRFWSWLNDEKQGGGALIDFAGYGAVWLRWYLGMPRTVYAVTTHTGRKFIRPTPMQRFWLHLPRTASASSKARGICRAASRTSKFLETRAASTWLAIESKRSSVASGRRFRPAH
jgi:predicted dehydrogenase